MWILILLLSIKLEMPVWYWSIFIIVTIMWSILLIVKKYFEKKIEKIAREIINNK